MIASSGESPRVPQTKVTSEVAGSLPSAGTGNQISDIPPYTPLFGFSGCRRPAKGMFCSPAINATRVAYWELTRYLSPKIPARAVFVLTASSLVSG